MTKHILLAGLTLLVSGTIGCGPAVVADRPAAVNQLGDAAPPEPAADAAPSTTGPGDPQPSGDHQHDGHGPEGHGPGMMGRGMMGRGMMGKNRGDMTTIHALFARRGEIRRTITPLPNGVETITESTDDEIASLLQEHVPAMEGRVAENRPLPPMTFHPLFTELIKHADQVEFDYESTDQGIKVTYTSNDPYVVRIIQEHAKLVSRFIKNGMTELHKPYQLPMVEKTEKEAESRRPSVPSH